MFRSYLNVALRNIFRNKVYSILNITGLAIGMATSMLIFLWVVDEISIDRYHRNADKVYRVLLKLYRDDKVQKVALTPPAMSVAFKKQIPEVADATRYYYETAGLVRSGHHTGDEEWFTYADPSFFSMFTFEFIAGSSANPFPQNKSVIISERIANVYFGNIDPIGKSLQIKNDLVVKVSGVIKNEPNTHLIHDFVLPFSLLAEFGRDLGSWNYIDYCNYIQLEDGVSQERAEELINSYLIDEIGSKRSFVFLQPLKEMHLYSDFDYEYINAGDIRIVYTTALIATFILLIACINFMNLSTAQAYKRYREVGWRKVCGATSSDIARQFLGESILMAMLAFLFSMVIIEITLDQFNILVNKNITMYSQGPLLVAGGFAVIVFITGLISGSYPAFYLSAINPSDILRKTIHKGRHRVIFRKILVIFQFTISIFLIIVTWTVWQQLAFIQKQDLGYDRNDMIVMTFNEEIREDYNRLKVALEGKPGILDITTAFMPPIWDGPQTTIYDWEGNTEGKRYRFYYQVVDLNYIETFRIKVLQGESFSREHLKYPDAYYILNSEAIRQLGISDPVGKVVQIFDEGIIVGVVEDFNFHTIHKKIEPLVITLRPSEAKYMFFRVDPENYDQALLNIGQAWNSLGNSYPFEFENYNDLIYGAYSREDKTGTLLRYFTLLAIFISSLGLYGLSLFMSGTRRKEIGIRKALGATTGELIGMMVMEFSRWIIYATLISWPLAFWMLHTWLDQFAYHTEIKVHTFILSGAIALAIGLGTTLVQSFRTARTNPAETIRYE